MKSSKEYWDDEYSAGSPHFHALASHDPSISAKTFTEYLKERRLPLAGKVLEVGCGFGRNSNWLASQGFEVTGVDFSQVAIEEAKKRATKLGLQTNFQVLDVTGPWPIEDESLDYVLDFVTSHLFTLDELTRYVAQAKKKLETGGKLVVYTIDRTKDLESQKLLKEHAGKEPNTYIIPEMGHLERTFDLEDIQTLYSPLKLEFSKLIHRPTRFTDQTYDRYYWWTVLRK